MSEAREIEFEVLGKDSPRPGRAPGADPIIAIVSRLMDSAITIPGTKIRFGLDPIFGLLPGLGDGASTLISVLLLLRSSKHGVPKIVLTRMAANVLLNAAVGAVPVLGDLFSVWFRSNDRNYGLLQKHAGSVKTSTRGDWFFLIALIAALVLSVTFLIALALGFWGWVFAQLKSLTA